MRLLGERKRKGRVGRRERYASRQGKHCSSSGREALGSISCTNPHPPTPKKVFFKKDRQRERLPVAG
jgi:hypothetical protein